MFEYNVSKGILDSYHSKFQSALQSDAIIVGSGPSGLIAGYFLAKAGKKVVMFERELAPGGEFGVAECFLMTLWFKKKRPVS